MDVWEHAFMRDYKATERTQYVEAFFRNIDWATVERRLQETGVVHPAGRGAGTAPVRGCGQERFLRKAMAQGQMPTKLALKVYYRSITVLHIL